MSQDIACASEPFASLSFLWVRECIRSVCSRFNHDDLTPAWAKHCLERALPGSCSHPSHLLTMADAVLNAILEAAAQNGKRENWPTASNRELGVAEAAQ